MYPLYINMVQNYINTGHLTGKETTGNLVKKSGSTTGHLRKGMLINSYQYSVGYLDSNLDYTTYSGIHTAADSATLGTYDRAQISDNWLQNPPLHRLGLYRSGIVFAKLPAGCVIKIDTTESSTGVDIPASFAVITSYSATTDQTPANGTDMRTGDLFETIASGIGNYTIEIDNTPDYTFYARVCLLLLGDYNDTDYPDLIPETPSSSSGLRSRTFRRSDVTISCDGVETPI